MKKILPLLIALLLLSCSPQESKENVLYKPRYTITITDPLLPQPKVYDCDQYKIITPNRVILYEYVPNGGWGTSIKLKADFLIKNTTIVEIKIN